MFPQSLASTFNSIPASFMLSSVPAVLAKARSTPCCCVSTIPMQGRFCRLEALDIDGCRGVGRDERRACAEEGLGGLRRVLLGKGQPS